MPLIVQKFGGTSVADTQKILGAARKAIRAAQAGHQVVVVVSAMGKTTDHLIALAREITHNPSSREMDMLMSSGEQVTIALMAIALESLGHKAVSMTGAQIGIKTDNFHMKARIKSISTDRMKKALGEGKIVIAAGFQGIDDNGDITTLGRGGSDTSAVALAAALGADECEIYTDVDGIYTTDPRLLPEARKVAQISYDEMLELASLGAGVMHSRSIEFAKKFGVAVHVRSSFSDAPGTLIVETPENDTAVSGAAIEKQEARLTLVGVPDKPGIAMHLFSKIAEANIPTDMIVQNVGQEGHTDIAFTVPITDADATRELLLAVAIEVGADEVIWSGPVTKVSVVGLEMRQQEGVAQKMFRAISEQNVNIDIITTSDIKISVLVSQDNGLSALRAVHGAFGLDKVPTSVKSRSRQKVVSSLKCEAGAMMISRLSGMEDLLIEAIFLNQAEAQITMANIPDRPGVVAELFEQIAAVKIMVDIIVQSSGHNGKAIITFTIPRNTLAEALDQARQMAKKWQSDEPLYNPAIAILSVRGTGLRSHTELAYRMFKTLADSEINVNVISTSERNIAVAVDEENGEKGLALLKKEFAGVMM